MITVICPIRLLCSLVLLVGFTSTHCHRFWSNHLAKANQVVKILSWVLKAQHRWRWRSEEAHRWWVMMWPSGRTAMSSPEQEHAEAPILLGGSGEGSDLEHLLAVAANGSTMRSAMKVAAAPLVPPRRRTAPGWGLAAAPLRCQRRRSRTSAAGEWLHDRPSK